MDGWMHGNNCDTYQVHDVNELKQRLTYVWHGYGQRVINDAMYEWHNGSGRVFMSKEVILSILYDSRAHEDANV